MNREFGKGFSVATLTNIRKFYLTYQDRISEPVVTEFAIEKSQPLVMKLKNKPPFHLSWSHYLILMRIENMEERNFYERQAWKEGWGKRELGRQYGSSLYERLLIGKDKDKILETSQKGQIIEKPGDIVKDPYVLEFLGLDERTDFSESELESRLIDHLQELLTLPKNSNIYASKYQLYLPDKKLLQDKLKEWMKEESEVEFMQ